jgi:hypothetical protein
VSSLVEYPTRTKPAHSALRGRASRTSRTVRIILAVFLTAVSACLGGLWFIMGVTASKWIGLDSMAVQMEKLNTQSRLMGYLALTLQVLAFWVFPPKQAQPGLLSGACQGTLSYPNEARTNALWRTAWERYGIRLAFLIFGTLGFLIIYLVVGLLSRVLSGRH